MPAEKFVTEFVKEAGFTPIPDRAIIVTYAPSPYIFVYNCQR